MNQILNVDNSMNNTNKYKQEKVINNYNKKPTAQTDIKKVLRFFVIALIILGILMLSVGGYQMYLDSMVGQEFLKPTISVTQVNEQEIVLKVENKIGLQSVVYSWNDGEEINIQLDNDKLIEEKIKLNNGSNTLKVVAIDINGQQSEYTQTYTVKGAVNISFEDGDGKLKIVIESEKEVAFINYRWDDDEETKININAKESVQTVEVPSGTHTITVAAVDVENETTEAKREVVGSEKPTIKFEVNEEQDFVTIRLTDSEGLKKVTAIANETDKFEKELEGVKESGFNYTLKEGETTLVITVENTKGIIVEKEFSVTK